MYSGRPPLIPVSNRLGLFGSDFILYSVFSRIIVAVPVAKSRTPSAMIYKNVLKNNLPVTGLTTAPTTPLPKPVIIPAGPSFFIPLNV